jgi:hypothetical protein
MRLPWPINEDRGERYGDCEGTHVVYFANISTGVMLFCKEDWGRGEHDRDRRAAGHVGNRLSGKIYRVGRTKFPFSEECYPNLRSAELRWTGLTEILKGAPDAR